LSSSLFSSSLLFACDRSITPGTISYVLVQMSVTMYYS
jgi:hypothetical protein